MPPKPKSAHFPTSGVILVTVIFLFLAGAYAFWNFVANWLSPTSPTTTPIPTLHPSTPTPASTITPTPEFPVPSPTVYPTQANIPLSFMPVNVNPLSGLALSNLTLLERRPIAVKVSNFPRYTRPWQSGLSLADQVFEYYLEDGLSRFVAVVYGNNAQRIGPVRSARFFDEHVIRMYQAIFVFASADIRVRDYLFKTDLKNYLMTPNEYDCPPLCRDSKIEDYNNVFLDTSKVSDYLAWRGTDNDRPTLEGFFSVYAPPSNLTADRVMTNFSDYDYNYWEYEPERQKYLRYQETSDLTDGKPPAYAPQMDALTGQQLFADNVIIVFVRYIHNPQSTGEMYVVDLFGEGQAYVFRDGLAYPATWVRTAWNQPLSFEDTNGIPLPLKPGVTYYEVLGLASTTTQEGADWYFEFGMP